MAFIAKNRIYFSGISIPQDLFDGSSICTEKEELIFERCQFLENSIQQLGMHITYSNVKKIHFTDCSITREDYNELVKKSVLTGRKIILSMTNKESFLRKYKKNQTI